MNENLPWQQNQWQQFTERLALGRLPHALLLTGKNGLGKRLFAERLSQTLLCSATSAKNQGPCGQCRHCELFAIGHHPDYILVEPEDDKKPIRIDQIRALSEFLERTSQAGGYKIALLTPAEKMNINAANSLLKTLEEPPGSSLLLLLSASPNRLPATIRSRCQQIAFYPPDEATGKAWLNTRITAENNDSGLLFRLAGGAPLQALQFDTNDYLTWRRQLFTDYCDTIAGSKAPASFAERCLEQDLSANLTCLLSWHMDMVRLKLSNDTKHLNNLDLTTGLQTMSGKLTVQQLFELYRAATDLFDLARTQANMSLHIENFLHKVVNSAAK